MHVHASLVSQPLHHLQVPTRTGAPERVIPPPMDVNGHTTLPRQPSRNLQVPVVTRGPERPIAHTINVRAALHKRLRRCQVPNLACLHQPSSRQTVHCYNCDLPCLCFFVHFFVRTNGPKARKDDRPLMLAAANTPGQYSKICCWPRSQKANRQLEASKIKGRKRGELNPDHLLDKQAYYPLYDVSTRRGNMLQLYVKVKGNHHACSTHVAPRRQRRTLHYVVCVSTVIPATDYWGSSKSRPHPCHRRRHGQPRQCFGVAESLPTSQRFHTLPKTMPGTAKGAMTATTGTPRPASTP